MACKLLVVACGDLIPQPEVEPGPPALRVQSFNHWTTREVPPAIFLYLIFILCWSIVDLQC